VREVLKQPQYSPMPVPRQVAVMVALVDGLLDDVPLDKIAGARDRIGEAMDDKDDLSKKILGGEELADDDRKQLENMVREVI
jgi:F-type H+-transporting ATPase subunit alpha